jgi:hypothetical protein
VRTYDPEVGTAEVPARVAPGPMAGPPLTDLVVELRRTADAMMQLYRQAQFTARERVHRVKASAQLDANGDAAIELFQVPQGSTGYLMILAIEQGTATPGTPITSATLWHAIFGHTDGGQKSAAQAAAGTLLDCSPITPAADAQIPYVYTYGDRYGSPTLVGPGTFYLVIDASTASEAVHVNGSVLVCQPEP